MEERVMHLFMPSYKRSQLGQEQITNMQDSHRTIGIQGNECMIAVGEHQ